MSFTYAQLKQAIQDYTQNTETTFVNNLPLFIRIAEERILKSVQLDLFRKNVTANATASNKYLACPNDFLAPFSLSYEVSGSKTFIDFKDVSFLQTYTTSFWRRHQRRTM
jgi:ribosomal protein S18